MKTLTCVVKRMFPRGPWGWGTLLIFSLLAAMELFAAQNQKPITPAGATTRTISFLPPDYFPLNLGNRWIYTRTDSRFKKAEQISVEIISTPIIKWRTYYVFSRLPFVPGLEDANNVLVRYDPETKCLLRLIEDREVSLFPVGQSIDAKFDASVDENGVPVANRLSYITCADCEDKGMEMVFDRGIGVTAILFTRVWGTEDYELKSANVNQQHFGEVIREEKSKSSREAKVGGPVVSRADPIIKLEVEKSKPNAHLLMRVKNPTESFLSLNFTSSQTYDFIIRNKETGTEVWRWSKGNFFSRVVRNLALLPQEEWRFEVVWDFKDNNREDLAHGVYELSAILTTREPRESEPMTITIP